MIVTFIIKLYQALLSVKHSVLISVFGYHSVCKHRPTCSQYMIKEIKKSGTITGLYRGFWRVITCW